MRAYSKEGKLTYLDLVDVFDAGLEMVDRNIDGCINLKDINGNTTTYGAKKLIKSLLWELSRKDVEL